ncbi:MAG: porin family protein [Flavobacterium sp.]|nr:porin family protein [Flavobacterium sp.]
MKKIILTLGLVLAFGLANAQDKKPASTGEGFANGDVFVTGLISYGNTNDKNTDTKTDSFKLIPQVALFVSDNIAVGVRVGFTTDKTKTAGTTTVDNPGFLAGAFARYYFTPASKFSLFGQLGYDYMSKTDNLALPNKIKTYSNNFGLGLGLNYFVSSNFSIETGLALLNFGNEKTDVSGDNGNTSFKIGGDFTKLSIGVNYKF